MRPKFLLDKWTPHESRLDCLTFDGEVGYSWELEVVGVTANRLFEVFVWLTVNKGMMWPLLCPPFSCSMPGNFPME